MTPEVQAAVERVMAHCPGMPPAMEPLDRDDLRVIISALAASEARREELEEFYRADFAVRNVGLLNSTEKQLRRRDRARAALNPQQEGSRDHG